MATYSKEPQTYLIYADSLISRELLGKGGSVRLGVNHSTEEFFFEGTPIKAYQSLYRLCKVPQGNLEITGIHTFSNFKTQINHYRTQINAYEPYNRQKYSIFPQLLHIAVCSIKHPDGMG